MPREGDAADVRRLLGQRSDVLALLVERSFDKSTLTDTLDVSRSTVDRTVRRLDANGLVRRDGSLIETTLAGRLAYDAYRRYRNETADVVRLNDLLRELPPTADVGHDLLDGATAYRNVPPATGRPVEEVTALIGEATRMRACASAVHDSTAPAELHRMVTDRGGTGEVVYTADLADHVRHQYFDIHHEMVATGRYRAYEIADLAYELFVLDAAERTHVVVLVYGDGGTLRGTILNDTDAAVAWGAEAFERRRAEAVEFTDDFRIGPRTDGGVVDMGG